MHDYDVIVLGGGTAGTAAATAATRAGARVAMVNAGELGGLCILRGCMPTKALLASAHAIHDARHLEPFGARLEGRVVPDFKRIIERKNAQVARFKQAKIEGIENGGYDVIDARARFVEGDRIDVAGRTLSARSYVIATGSAAATLPIPGIEEVPVLTSDDVMRLERQPRSLLVQGAGAIGLELAQFFARVGSEVLIVNRSPLLTHYDTECGAELTRALAGEPRLQLALPGTIERLERDADGLVARVTSAGEERRFRADALLMAVGRDALLDDLGLEHVGLRARGGRLEHDATMQTSNPRIWVAGDATGREQILHLASHEGETAGHNAAGGAPRREVDYRLLAMQVVFTDPPYAQAGLTEQAARVEGRDVVVGRAVMAQTGRAITMETRHGLWKLVADRLSGEILGTSIVGPRADDLVHTVAVMIRCGVRVEQISEFPWYHPTLSEVLLDLARDLRRQL